MFSLLRRYAHWLHTQWPAGTVEKLPFSDEHGRTNLPGVRIVGDLTGVPLLKFSSKTGVDAVRGIAAELEKEPSGREEGVLDLAIIGGGVSGISAAIEAKKAGLRFAIFEAAQPFSTVANFPARKPIYTYPAALRLEGGLHFSAEEKEPLLAELEAQRAAAGIEPTPARVERIGRKRGVIFIHGESGETLARARRAIVAIGRTGAHRRLGVPGEELDKVFNRLFDPKDFTGKNVLVVGGGDSTLESAIALAGCGARVTLSYRGKEFARAKSENVAKLAALQQNPMADVQVEHPTSECAATTLTSGMVESTPPGAVTLAMSTRPARIEPESVTLEKIGGGGGEITLANDAVFTMLGREAPLDFFRRSGLRVRGDWRPLTWISATLFLLFCVCLYHWKSGHPAEFALQQTFRAHGWFPFNVDALFKNAGGKLAEWSGREANILYTIRRGLSGPSFYYTLAYCACVVGFGILRIRRRRTPYVLWQTLTLMCVQCVPLFILPEIILPWMGHNGWFEPGRPLRWLADHLFESYDGGAGHERAYWRAYGFILAWPLFVYNVFTEHPMWLWLVISLTQTFVIIPLIIFRWGKGAYCGWICSCGALAETMGDAHRRKMPHGPLWNRVNMLGQAVLAFACVLLALRIIGWIAGPDSWATVHFEKWFQGVPYLNYAWSIDLFLGGMIGVGLYFWFSGRVWCRFACPLAALMHIYTRFSRYRIFPDKKKCISCNICTSVCHQGIDVMNFANKGLPMADPECVRCSACVQMCPTGVLSFGRFDKAGKIVLDKTPASPVQMREGK